MNSLPHFTWVSVTSKGYVQAWGSLARSQLMHHLCLAFSGNPRQSKDFLQFGAHCRAFQSCFLRLEQISCAPLYMRHLLLSAFLPSSRMPWVQLTDLWCTPVQLNTQMSYSTSATHTWFSVQKSPGARQEAPPCFSAVCLPAQPLEAVFKYSYFDQPN